METRYSDRKRTTGTVTLCCEGRVRAGTILDVSVPGCHLATTLRLQKGQSVCMDVYLTNNPPMRIDLGVVRWAADGEAGIEFIRMPEEDAARLRWYAGRVGNNAPRSDVDQEAGLRLRAVGFKRPAIRHEAEGTLRCGGGCNPPS